MKLRYGFVTNSSSSSFVVKSDVRESPYTVEEVRTVLNYLLDLFNSRFNDDIKEGDDYIVSDSKDINVISKIFNEYAAIELTEDSSPIHCKLPDDLRKKVSNRCSNCPLNDRCEDQGTLIDIIKDGDVFVVAYASSMPKFILDSIDGLFTVTYINKYLE